MTVCQSSCSRALDSSEEGAGSGSLLSAAGRSTGCLGWTLAVDTGGAPRTSPKSTRRRTQVVGSVERMTQSETSITRSNTESTESPGPSERNVSVCSLTYLMNQVERATSASRASRSNPSNCLALPPAPPKLPKDLQPKMAVTNSRPPDSAV